MLRQFSAFTIYKSLPEPQLKWLREELMNTQIIVVAARVQAPNVKLRDC
jgi:hypothetical protein